MKYGITFGAFDLVHPGHVLLFKDAKTQCDFLWVGLHRDPSLERPTKNRPALTVKERRIMLEACEYVDEVIEYDTEAELVEILKDFKPDIRIIGSDYEGKDFTGKDLCPVYFHQRNHEWSSSALRERIWHQEGLKRVCALVS